MYTLIESAEDLVIGKTKSLRVEVFTVSNAKGFNPVDK